MTSLSYLVQNERADRDAAAPPNDGLPMYPKYTLKQLVHTGGKLSLFGVGLFHTEYLIAKI